MKNGSNAVRGRHLESLANMFIGKFTSVDSIVAGLLEELEPFTGATSIRGGTDGLVPKPVAGDEVKFLCGDGTWSTVASGSCILDTVCPSINGGMWYDVVNDIPVVKIYYNGQAYPLGSAEDTELTVVPSPLNVPAGESATATISCNSGGEITVTSLTAGVRVERSGNVITVYHAAGIENASVQINVAATPGYTPAEFLLPVTMGLLDPNLTVSPSALTISAGSSGTASVSYAGSGTISLQTGLAGTIYDSVNNRITVPHVAGVDEATVNVSLSASTGYTADSEALAVTMEKLSPHLTIDPSVCTVPVSGSIYADVDFDGNGEISLDPASPQLTYISSSKKIKADWTTGGGSVSTTVSLTASAGYTSDSATFTATMEEPETVITVNYSASATNGAPVTATVSCNSGAAISATGSLANGDAIPFTWTFDGTNLTLPFYEFYYDTNVVITFSVDARGVYPAATRTFAVTYIGNYSGNRENLVVCMPFNETATEDICDCMQPADDMPSTIHSSNNSSYGIPNGTYPAGWAEIKDGALRLDKFTGALFDTDLTFTEDGFNISFWLYIESVHSELNPYSIVVNLLRDYSDFDSAIARIYGYPGQETIGYYVTDGYLHGGGAYAGCPHNQWTYIELDLNTRVPRQLYFVNGQLHLPWADTNIITPITATKLQFGLGGLVGYIRDFKIYNYSRHTANFTPPTRPF